MVKLFEGKERIADLSKGWQQFVLGLALFYVVFAMLSLSIFSMFSISPMTGSRISTVPNPSSVLVIALGFGAIYFLVKFIKRYNASSPTDIGFGLSIIAGVLLLIAFLSIYSFSPMIVEALGGSASRSTGLIASQQSNVLVVLGSMVFYLIAGFGLAFFGNYFNNNKTPLLGIFALLIVPMLLMSTVFSFGSLADNGISMLLQTGGIAVNQWIAQLVVFLIFLIISAILLFLLFGRSEPKMLYFQSIAFKIIAAGFLGALFISLINFSSLLSIDFQNTELMKVMALFGEWLIKVIFFGGMAFLMFALCDLFNRFSKEAPKQDPGKQTPFKPTPSPKKLELPKKSALSTQTQSYSK